MPTIAVEVGIHKRKQQGLEKTEPTAVQQKKTARLNAERFNSERLSPPPLIS